MKSGVVLVDKQPGVSSAGVVGRLRRQLGQKKIGHAGTLDPLASGLLVCLTGGATRLASYAESGEKRYSGTFRFGVVSDTDDICGVLQPVADSRPTDRDLEQAVQAFTGRISQIPPQVSAVKVGGERAYRLARRGQAVELCSREVFVRSFMCRMVDADHARFEVVCTKGTYIRALARDLGAALGCGAVVASLRRERSEPFSVDQALSVESIGVQHILDPLTLFPATPRLAAGGRLLSRLVRGEKRALEELLDAAPEAAAGERAVYLDECSGKFCGLLIRGGSGWEFGVNFTGG